MAALALAHAASRRDGPGRGRADHPGGRRACRVASVPGRDRGGPLIVLNDAWRRARSILCVRLDALGDVLMTTPALRALREDCPDRRLTLLTSPAGAEAAALVPALSDVIVYEAPWMKATAPRGGPAPDLALIERLTHDRFDAAVIFTVYSQNPLPA